MRIDFTVTDDEGNELGFGGTSSWDTLEELAHEVSALIQRAEFTYIDGVSFEVR